MHDSRDRLPRALADRYTIERELGAGGMATVYLAADLKHDRKVAIKVLRPELAAVLGAERFVQEIKTTAALSHPHILPLFDSGEADGFLYYVMPYIQGETIREKLNRETQFGIDEAVKITTEVADALDYAHQHGVIHRDIKPENILLHAGRPMVMDFGIALAVSAAAGGRMTETGLSLGTPHYMSPEQATADKQITARSDVYSLASVLYEMLTGSPPHLGGSAQQIIMKIVTETPAPVTQMRKSVPPNVAMAVAKALEKLPADRFDSARSFSAALTDPAFSLTTTPISPSRTAPRGRDWLPWTVAALALVAAGILALRLSQAPLTSDLGPPWVVDLNLPERAAFWNGLALSADGSNLVYAGRQQLWRRAAGSVDPVPIPGTEGACCPAISPDGQQVAFMRGRDVYVIPMEGGTGQRLGTGFAYGDELAWTTDGYVVGAAHEIGGLIRIRSTGGPVERFTTTDTTAGEVEHYSPRALPDGKGVVFTILPRNWQQSVVGLRIGVVGPAGGAHSVLLPGRVAAFSYPGYLLVTRADGTVAAAPFDLATRRVTGDPQPVFTVPAVRGVLGWAGYIVVANSGTVVYVGASDERGRELVWLTRAGRTAPVDFEATSLRTRVSLSGDGRMVAFSAFSSSEPPRVEIRDRRTGANSRIGVAGEWVSDPSITADGRALLYRVIAPGRGGIYRAEFGRLGDATRLLPDSGASGPQLSPDGRTLYFFREGVDGADLVARQLGTEGGVEEVLLRRSISSRVSPDGRWLAFVDTAGGQSRLFARSTDPNRPERWLVSSSAQGPVRWAPSGRELYFFDHDTLNAAQVAGTTTFVVERTTRLFSASRAEVDDFAVGPDGRFLFLRTRPGQTRTPLLRLDDWRRLLQRH